MHKVQSHKVRFHHIQEICSSLYNSEDINNIYYKGNLQSAVSSICFPYTG